MFYSPPSNAGAFGAATSGILQGLAQGQASRESSQRMDMLQQQFDQAQEAKESQEFMSRLYELERVKKNKGNIAKLVPGLNKFMADSKYLNDGEFVMDNWGNYRNENGTYDQDVVRKYGDATGLPFIPGQSDEENWMNGRLQFKDSDGIRDFDFDTFSEGSSKYQQFRKDKAYEDLMQQIQIEKARGGKGDEKVSDAKRIAVLRNKDKPSAEDLDELEILETKMKTDIKNNVTNMFSPENKQLIEELKAGKDVKSEAVDNLLQAQITSGQTYKDLSKKQDAVSMAGNLTRTYDRIKDMFDKGGYETGWAQNIKSDLLSTVGSEGFRKMDETAQKQALLTKVRNSRVMNSVFDVIKKQSGSEFTEEEFARRLQVIAGGDLNKINDQTLLTVFGDFIKNKIDDTRTDLGNISSRYSGDKAELLRDLNLGTKGFEVPNMVTTTGKGTSGDALIGETSRQVEELGNLGGSLLKGGVVEGIKEGVGAVGKAFGGNNNWPKATKDDDPELILKAPNWLEVLDTMNKAEANKWYKKIENTISPEQFALLQEWDAKRDAAEKVKR